MAQWERAGFDHTSEQMDPPFSTPCTHSLGSLPCSFSTFLRNFKDIDDGNSPSSGRTHPSRERLAVVLCLSARQGDGSLRPVGELAVTKAVDGGYDVLIVQHDGSTLLYDSGVHGAGGSRDPTVIMGGLVIGAMRPWLWRSYEQHTLRVLDPLDGGSPAPAWDAEVARTKGLLESPGQYATAIDVESTRSMYLCLHDMRVRALATDDEGRMVFVDPTADELAKAERSCVNGLAFHAPTPCAAHALERPTVLDVVAFGRAALWRWCGQASCGVESP